MRAGRDGLALVVVLGVLAVLAVLAVAFATMARLERRASAQRTLAAKAQLLARSGIEDALARLELGQDPAYAGEDLNGDGTLNPGVEILAQAYRPSSFDREACPARHALRPSWFARDPAGSPALATVEGRPRGYSGGLSPDGALTGSHYAIKVEDESAKINVNGGFLDALNRDADGIPDFRDADVRPSGIARHTIGWNFQLARILDVLGSQPELGVPGLGQRALASRPRGGYAGIRALEAALGATTDLSPYLTVASWTDRQVVQPNARDGEPAQAALAEVKKMRPPLGPAPDGRPPVNLNAATRPVLVSLLEGLQGVESHDICAAGGVPTLCGITPATASGIAGALLARRASAPFQAWPEFSAFCDTLVSSVIVGADFGSWGEGLQATADVLKANFDPNTHLNKQLPDQLMWRHVDKSDLAVWSTEGSLGPTGVFRITASGRVLGAGGRLLAEASQSALVEAFTLLRQTTQEDFVAGRTALDAYLSTDSAGLPQMCGAEASWNTWKTGALGPGLAAMTYPCPPKALPAEASDFDGSIGLATVETANRFPFGGALRFLQHFDEGWDARRGSPAGRVPGPSDACLQPDASSSVWPSAAGAEPNTLVPDGAHLQRDRCPAYMATNLPPRTVVGGIPANHGILCYWAKPAYARAPQAEFSCVRGVRILDADVTQALILGRCGGAWGGCVENSPNASDSFKEMVQAVSQEGWNPSAFPNGRAPGARWHLVAVLFDTNEAAASLQLRADVRGAQGLAPSRGTTGWYSSMPIDPTTGEDLLSDSSLRMVLGSQDQMEETFGANAVMDEFAVLDFGDATGLSVPLGMDRFAPQVFADGRYYKQDDARFLSGLLDPRPGSAVRLLRASWTAYLPREGRKEIRVLGQTAGTLGIVTSSSRVDRATDPVLASSSLALELLDRDGTLSGPALLPLGQGGAVRRLLSGFRYRLTLKPNPLDPATGLPDRAGQPVLESPWLDDVSFQVMPPDGPRMLLWGNGR